MKKVLFLIIFLAAVLSAGAKVSVEARIDSMEIFIGQQVHVTVTVVAGESSNVVFPTFKPQQQVTPGVEVLDATDVSTSEMDNNEAKFAKTYTLTSFDGNLYYLPPFAVKVDGKIHKSKSLALKVLEVEIDTTRMDFFFGPKDVQDNPFQWNEWSHIFWLSVIMLLLAGAGYYLYLILRDNKPIKISIKVVRKLLPHQRAMKEIELIKAEKMITAENSKEYYTKLTDTLRTYIRERYGFNAMEMTSNEIIERLTEVPDKAAIDELRTLFQTADLVKFAKYSTLINENDKNLVNAIEFINSTKVENQPTEEIVKPQLSEEEKQSVKTRRVLKIAISLVSIFCIAILGYVIYSMYLLFD